MVDLSIKSNILDDNAYTSYNVVYFLYIYFSFKITSPSVIPPIVKQKVEGIIHNYNWYLDGDYLFDWRKVDTEDYLGVFNGKRILSIITSPGIIKSDPTERLFEIFLLFKSIVQMVGFSEIINCCVREVSSILNSYITVSDSILTLNH